ncbi:hypothetical protein NEOLEDRAFT_1080378, partial [Neolentinus lepideus HHB14362 ss-1]
MNKVLNVDIEAYAGLNMIFAGDFAQLPPPGPCHHPLYSDNVGVATDSSMSPAKQKASMGKAAWHQFNRVVILRENMRQLGQSENDHRFRVALENMRYKACTRDDIALLQSRVPHSGPDSPSLADALFHYISIITGQNANCDTINALSAPRFAADHNQELVHFYSSDTWGGQKQTQSLAGSRRASLQYVDPIRRTNTINPDIQNALWELPPSLSDHAPGVLPLCIGMPVMLKHNDATELGVTNGAEATVVGWRATDLPSGHKALDTLFVKLVSPPKPIKLHSLPENVVPITRKKRRVTCMLPNDDKVRIDREQVSVLLNFAMTDFCSQGRTRVANVCDLCSCSSHQSYYTTLSWSSSLQGTCIPFGFDPGKITGGLPGYMRK